MNTGMSNTVSPGIAGLSVPMGPNGIILDGMQFSVDGPFEENQKDICISMLSAVAAHLSTQLSTKNEEYKMISDSASKSFNDAVKSHEEKIAIEKELQERKAQVEQLESKLKEYRSSIAMKEAIGEAINPLVSKMDETKILVSSVKETVERGVAIEGKKQQIMRKAKTALSKYGKILEGLGVHITMFLPSDVGRKLPGTGLLPVSDVNYLRSTETLFLCSYPDGDMGELNDAMANSDNHELTDGRPNIAVIWLPAGPTMMPTKEFEIKCERTRYVHRVCQLY